MVWEYLTDEDKRKQATERIGRAIDTEIQNARKSVQSTVESIKLPSISPPKIQMPQIDIPDINIPTPRIQAPSLPDISIPQITPPQIDLAAPVRQAARTASSAFGDVNDFAASAVQPVKSAAEQLSVPKLADTFTSKVGDYATASARQIGDTARAGFESPITQGAMKLFQDPRPPEVIFGEREATPEETTAYRDFMLSSHMPGAGIGSVGTKAARPTFMGLAPKVAAKASAAQAAAQAAVSTNVFIQPLRELAEIVAEIKTAPNELLQKLVSPINPSAAETDIAGKIGIAVQGRQRPIAREAADAAVQLVTGPFEPRGGIGRAVGPGGKIFDIIDTAGAADDGFVRNIQPITPGKSTHWNDVFARPDDYILNPEQSRYIAIYRQPIEELENVRVAAGLPVRAVDLGPDTFYVPRHVIEKNGVKASTPSNASMSRHYEEAQAGVAAGVHYNADPVETLRLHLTAGLREVVEKQLQDAIKEPFAGAKTALGVKPKQLIPSDIIQRREDAALTFKGAVGRISNERSMAMNSRTVAAKEILSIRNDLSQAKQKLSGIHGELRGRGQTATGQRQTPLSTGVRLHAAEEEVKALTQTLREARQLSNEIPKFGRRTGKQGTSTSSLFQYTSAKQELQTATRLYNRDLKEATSGKKSWASGAIFGRPGATIGIKEWNGVYLAQDHYDALTRYIGERGVKETTGNWAARAAEKLANTVRQMSASFDFAMPVTQGLPILAANPKAWAKLTTMHYQAFADPSVYARYVAEPENREMMELLIKHGAFPSQNDFFAAAKPGAGLGLPDFVKNAVPKAVGNVAGTAKRQTLGRFESAYTTGLGVGRIEIGKAFKDSFSDPAELAQYVRNLSGGLDSGSLGVGTNQRAFESMWLAFSPKYIRSVGALIKDAATFDGSEISWQSRITLGRLVIGAGAMYYGVGKAMGKDDDELMEGLNPLNGKKFLSYRMGDDWVGIGTPFRSITQLLTKTGAAGFEAATGIQLQETPGREFDRFERLKSFGEADSQNNPLLSFATGRGAPALSLSQNALEAFTGANINPHKEIEGPLGFAKATGESALPFVAQGLMEGQSLGATAVSGFGSRVSPATPTDKLNDIAESKYGVKRFTELSPSRQDIIRRENPELAKKKIALGPENVQEYDKIRQQYVVEQQASDQRLAKKEISWDDWRSQFSSRRDKLRAAREAIYIDEQKEQDVRDPILKEYYALVAANRKSDGSVDWDKVDAGVGQKQLDQQYIDENTGLGWTPAVQAYRKAQQQARPILDKYMNIPRYRGLSAEDGETASKLITDARSLEKAQRISYSVALNRLTKERGIPAKIKVRARSPQSYANPARANYWKRNPILEQTYGSLAPEAVLQAIEEETF